jgi:hypothetical protein
VQCNTVTDPHLVTSYKMEVLRNSDIKARPLFRVTSEDGLQVSRLTFISTGILHYPESFVLSVEHIMRCRVILPCRESINAADSFLATSFCCHIEVAVCITC